MKKGRNETESMFIELTEVLNAGWRVVLEPAPDAKRFMGVPARVKLMPVSQTETGRGLKAVPAYQFNRYQMKTELPRAIHIFHALVFSKPQLARLKLMQITSRHKALLRRRTSRRHK